MSAAPTCSCYVLTRPPMPDPGKLIPADPSDLAAALAYALRYQGRKPVHNADEIMAEIVAKRLVEHLERAGFVVMKRPPTVGAPALGRGRGIGRSEGETVRARVCSQLSASLASFS